MERAAAVAADEVARPGGTEHAGGGGSCGTGARHHDADVLEALVDDDERIQQRSQDDDRGPMLVVVEDRDVQLLPQAGLNVEAARRRDVLEVDAAEDRRNRGHDSHDFVRILRRKAHRPGVDSAELLEQDCLPLHHRQRCLRPDVTQPQNSSAVAHDRHRVLLDRQIPSLLGIVGDRPRDACDTRRIGHRKVVARLERNLRDDFQLASEMDQEGPVREVLDHYAVERLDGLHDPCHVGLVGREHRHIANLLPMLDADEVDRVQQPARVGDRLGQVRKRSGPVLEVDAQGRAEGGGWVGTAHRVKAPFRMVCVKSKSAVRTRGIIHTHTESEFGFPPAAHVSTCDSAIP